MFLNPDSTVKPLGDLLKKYLGPTLAQLNKNLWCLA